jgi:N-glycosylase/DNA lyase
MGDVTHAQGLDRMRFNKSQSVTFTIAKNRYSLQIPGPNQNVMAGVKWGSAGELFTPAYWLIQCFFAEFYGSSIQLRLGRSLIEEIVACLLGGHGIKAETGIAAFENLRTLGLLAGPLIPERDLVEVLKTPLFVKGRWIRYRFPSQKAISIHHALSLMSSEVPPEKPLELRKWLLKIRGIGLKTASWITRNWMATDSVAIIDIHIWRAGKLVGLFHRQRPERDYLEMEDLFLRFSNEIRIKASTLDMVIWSQMRTWGHLVGNETVSK